MAAWPPAAPCDRTGRVPVAGAVLVVCALALVPGAASAQDSGAMDLPSLVRAAERHSHDLKAASHGIAAAEAKLSEARISPFFQFRSTAGFTLVPDAAGVPGYSGDSPNELERGFGPALRASIEGAVPLWTFGKIDAAKDAARSGIRAAEHGLARVHDRVVLDVRRAYYALQLALDTAQMISEAEPKLERALTRIDERLADGDADLEPEDRYRLATALAEVRARRSEVAHLETSSRAALEILTGLAPIRVPDCPLAPLAHDPAAPNWYRERALGHRPDLAMLSAAASARRAELDATTAKYFPDLALTMELGTEYMPGRTAYEYYTPLFVGAGVVAKWNLDFWGNSYRERHAEAKLLETQEQAALAREGVELEVTRDRSALLDARERMRVWDEGHREARRWFVSAAQGYEVGVVKPKDLIDGVSAYFRARFAHLSAIHDHNVALARLEQTTGTGLVQSDAWAQTCEPADGE